MQWIRPLDYTKLQVVEPRHDLLFAFPSIALHAVNPVACSGNAFADRRFSVNIWLDG